MFIAFSALSALAALGHTVKAAVVPDATSTALPTSTTVVAGLNVVAKQYGKTYFGSATDNPELTNTAYVAMLENYQMFGQITPENSMKWDATEPEPGVFTFTDGDQIANFAETNGQLLRGHNCVWYNQLPSWVTANNYDATQLAAVVQNHTATVVGHYAGKIWDVINEPLNDNGTFRQDVFYDTLGTDYITIALQAARTADPNAKLFINEYNIEGTGVKSTAILNLVSSLQSSGVPIDGVGMECHFIVGEVPETLVENWQQYADLGVIFSINELDIRMPLPATAAEYDQQKLDYQYVVNSCMQFTECVGITLWDYTDEYSWVPSTFSGYGDACPWDQNLDRKPAFDGIVLGLEGAALTGY